MSISKQTMTLAWTKEIAPDVLHIALKPEKPFDYIPGQFISLLFSNPDNPNKPIKRSYSIANTPSNSKSANYIEFAISYQKNGVASENLFNNLKIGEPIQVMGPAGRLVLLEQHPERYILIATGTGVTPYRAMLDQIKSIINTNNTKFLLLFGARNLDLSIYHQEFIEFSKNNPNFEFHMYLSREKLDSKTNIYNNIHHGYVQNGFNNFNLDPNKDMIYLCGNPNMIDDAFPILENIGFTAKSVRREKYISSK